MLLWAIVPAAAGVDPVLDVAPEIAGVVGVAVVVVVVVAGGDGGVGAGVVVEGEALGLAGRSTLFEDAHRAGLAAGFDLVDEGRTVVGTDVEARLVAEDTGFEVWTVIGAEGRGPQKLDAVGSRTVWCDAREFWLLTRFVGRFYSRPCAKEYNV